MLKRQITSKTAAILAPLGAQNVTAGPVFAINWFNTRSGWLYTLYNVLAARPLFAVGAKPFIKAKHLKTIEGAPGAQRDLLLVVAYPSGESLLDLLDNSFFQIISVLRTLAVKDFSFVLHKRLGGLDLEQCEMTRDKAYAVHHFRSSASMDGELTKIAGLAAESNISIFFAGEKAATLSIDNGDGDPRTLAFETHKLVIFEADSLQALEDALGDPAYHDFSQGLQSSYVGLLARIM